MKNKDKQSTKKSSQYEKLDNQGKDRVLSEIKKMIEEKEKSLKKVKHNASNIS